jgi:hypothetical protein
MNIAIRELAVDELDLVSGGSDPNYKFCWDGPAGSGTYPWYIDCEGGGAVKELIGAFLKGVDEGSKGGGHPK